MGGTSGTTQATQQQSTTQPWEPTQGLLKGIIGGVQGLLPNATPNAAENSAISTMRTNAAGSPSYGPQAEGLATDLMAGGPNRAGMAEASYDRLGANLAPTIAGDYLDPNKNPFFANTTNAISDNVTNRVNGLFAGAGRDMSGAHTGTLAREITNATAPIYAQLYGNERTNQLDAMKSYYGAGGATAGLLSGLDQTSFDNRFKCLETAINGVPAAANAGATNILNTEATARNLPLQNLAGILGLTLPIAGLGSQSQGTSNMQGTQTMSPIQQMQGLFFGGANSAFNGASAAAGKGLGIFGRMFG